MSDSETENKSARLAPELREMKLEEGDGAHPAAAGAASSQTSSGTHPQTPGADATPSKTRSKSAATSSPSKLDAHNGSPRVKLEHEEVIGGDITVKLEPGKAPKLARAASQKIVARAPQTFSHFPDATAEATGTFQVITDCIYAAKYLGTTEHALECDCAEEWDAASKTNVACGEDSDCINRATKMECVGDCGCGVDCQNQRFQQKQYANVSVIKTEKKGYGLRTDAELRPNDFIFEYIGEVINEGNFRRRMLQYDDEGIKHFYFMSLTKGEFVDATKKGNFGRFCNHSCNPNCYVDKWVVGDKLRMGIFAERHIRAGEELVFNYNVDRYGADPQPCYCGEPNCTGFIGGKTQTERATKLSNATIEALGIDDGDGWDTAVAKKPRRKKAGEDDEEYVNNVQPRSLEEDGVTKVMATLMQCKEKWIAVKLLSRIQRSEDDRVRHRVVRMHGYQILKTTISNFAEDDNVVLQVLDILETLPRITRNKIQDSKIEEVVEKLVISEDERVSGKSAELLAIWSKLEMGYRIPRVKRDPNAAAANTVNRFERREAARERSKSRSRSRSKSPPNAPSGPRSNVPSRNANFRPYRRPPPFNPLPPGWFAAVANGKTYYYSASGQTTWQRPTVPAAQPPPPPKEKSHEQKLQDIIRSITQNASANEKSSASVTPQPATGGPKKEKKKEGREKWRSYSEEKQKKVYENTMFPLIQHVMGKYKRDLPRDDLKRLAKEAAKKLVNSDFKHKRVPDPTKVTPKQEKAIKGFLKEFFDKAVAKKTAHDKRKAERKASHPTASATPSSALDSTPRVDEAKDEPGSDDDMGGVSDDDDLAKPDISPEDAEDDDAESSSDLKRKRVGSADLASLDGDDTTSPKKLRAATPPPPPPPPPPPAEGMDESDMTPVEEGTEPYEALFLAPGSAQEQLDVAKGSQEDLRPSPSDGASSRQSPTQLATPPTTNNGSCEHDSKVRERLQEVEVGNPIRLKHLDRLGNF